MLVSGGPDSDNASHKTCVRSSAILLAIDMAGRKELVLRSNPTHGTCCMTVTQFDTASYLTRRIECTATQPHKKHASWKGHPSFPLAACHPMASLQQVVEQLAVLAAKGTNGTSGPDPTSQTSPQRGPLDLMTSTPKTLFSASALRDWAILLVIGSLFETARRLLASLWYALINAFFITAVFEEEDVSFRTPLAFDRSMCAC